MHDFRLYQRINSLEVELDKLYKEVHTLKQIQQEMIEQLRKLKGEKNE